MHRLTRRQRQCVLLAGEGLRNKEIGLRLGLSERTVETHLAKAFNRMGVHDREEAFAVLTSYRQQEISMAETPEAPAVDPHPADAGATNVLPWFVRLWRPLPPSLRAMLGLVIGGSIVLAITIAGLQGLTEILFVGIERLSRLTP